MRSVARHELAGGARGRAGEALGWRTSRRGASLSTRPTISSTVRKPSSAMCSRRSSAMKRKKLTTCSGSPVKSWRSSSSCVATPTGQVLRWHLRIMMQPMAMRAPVAMPHSSAPSRVAMATSRPVRSRPSVWSTTRSRRWLRMSTWWASARPSSQGRPACLIDESGEAPVPPSWPEMRMASACALATPAAIVPTPTSATSLTLMRACGLAFLRS